MNSINTALGILHVATGAFFTTTGLRKCFIGSVRKNVFNLFESHRVPMPARYAVVAGEFLGGLGLLFGALTQLAAAGLLVIMFGAYLMDTWPTIKAKNPAPVVPSKLLSNALCTPEAQLIVILFAIMFAGAGNFSLDHLIGG